MRIARLSCLLLLLLPGTAWAGEATIVSRELPVGLERKPAGARSPARFDLVGLHWQGRGRVLFRTRSLAGRWSSWRPAAPEAEDVPDAASSERRARRGWRLGNPYWVGPSDRLEYRLEGSVRRLRAWFVWSPVERVPLRRVSLAGSPPVLPRLAWNADERIRRGPPRYAPAVDFAVVHHTAGASGYDAATSVAIVRGIELYHVRGNGWNDIGYNFLVDRFGQVFGGRYGGVDRNVIGAHAEGFNSGSAGVAVIGNYGARSISQAAQRALARLLAWRLDVAHVDPLGFLTWTSAGNARFLAGTPVFLRAIAGHRDTGFTSCPGDVLYRQIPAVARTAARIGLPKLYAPAARGAAGGQVRFSARLSSPASWTVTVRDGSGREVARGSGAGAAIGWTWNAASAPPGRYSWTMEAGADVRPAQGTLGRAGPLPPPPSPPLLAALALDPAVISPDADGVDDFTLVSYTLSGRAAVTASVQDAGGAVVATLFAAQLQGARKQSFPWTAEGLADGRYRLTVAASGEDGRTAELEAELVVDRTLSAVTLSTPVLSPNGDGVADVLGIAYALSAPAEVTVEIRQSGIAVATAFSGPVQAGPQQATWDASTPLGPAPDGAYEAVVIARSALAETRLQAGFTIDRRA